MNFRLLSGFFMHNNELHTFKTKDGPGESELKFCFKKFNQYNYQKTDIGSKRT